MEINVNAPGTYILEIVDNKGCRASDFFDLSFVSGDYVNETITVIDIPWPMPKNVTWKFQGANVVTNSNGTAQVGYTEVGNQSLTV